MNARIPLYSAVCVISFSSSPILLDDSHSLYYFLFEHISKTRTSFTIFSQTANQPAIYTTTPRSVYCPHLLEKRTVIEVVGQGKAPYIFIKNILNTTLQISYFNILFKKLIINFCRINLYLVEAEQILHFAILLVIKNIFTIDVCHRQTKL